MKRKIYLFLTIILLVLLFYFSVTPGTDVKGVTINAGFLPHLIAYFLLSFLIFKLTKSFSLSIFLSGTYGLLIEIIQYVIPYRSFQFLDVLLNFIGASFVLVFKLKKVISKEFHIAV